MEIDNNTMTGNKVCTVCGKDFPDNGWDYMCEECIRKVDKITNAWWGISPPKEAADDTQ